jgi:uncharacterized cupin superfamily protein
VIAGAAGQRLVCADVLSQPTHPDGGSEVLDTSSAELTTLGGCEVGLWDAGPGTDVDVEVHEVFLVLEGSGTLTFDDGSAIALRPGVLVRLRSGDRTTWAIDVRLRKVYLGGGPTT